MEPQPPQPQPEPPMATAVPERPAPPTRRRGRPIFLLFFFFVFMCLCGSLLFNLIFIAGNLVSLDAGKVQEEHFSHERTSSNKVAVITLEGTIISGEGFIKKQIDQAKKDENVKAIVLRVNSPGGTVTGSDYIYHHLQKLAEEREIPIVVSMGGVAASGGYYVSMACGNKNEDVIFAEPTTWTGSIGVRVSLLDISKLLKKYDVESETIASHRLKTMGSMLTPITDEEREIWRGLIDEVFDRFKDVVKSGRAKFNEDPEALNELATGQVFTAKQAKENGLIDEIGFIEKAIDRAIELANLDEGDVHVVRYKREPTLADVLIGVRAEKPGFDIETLLDLNTPRAYYLFTRSPALLKSP